MGAPIGIVSMVMRPAKSAGLMHGHRTGVRVIGLLTCIFFFAIAAGTNWLLGGLAGGILFLGISMLWRPGESPVLLMMFTFQWLEVNLILYHATIVGLPIEVLGSYAGSSGDLPMAIKLSNIALLFLAIGFRVGMGPASPSLVRSAVDQARAEPLRVWVKLYLLALALSLVFSSIAHLSGAFYQLFYSATRFFRWAFFFMLTYVSFRRRPAWIYWWLFFAFEVFFSIGAFFSEFATVFFMTLFALIASVGRITSRSIRPFVVVFTLMLMFAMVWTMIKGDYRAFVNKGTGQQVVLVDRTQQLNKITELSLGGAVVSVEALERLANRIEYVTFFGIVLDVVPKLVPHANGQIWSDALLRPFMPRLLFPGKSAIDDSDRSREYTLRNMATAAQGTSISLGYVAESYIDFGIPWMFSPIFMLAVAIGYMFRWLQHAPLRQRVWRMGLASVAVFPFFDFGTSITKSAGALVLSALIGWIFVRFSLQALILWVGKTVRL